MYVSIAGLFLIVLACLSFGCCVGVLVMAMCKVSALNKEELE